MTRLIASAFVVCAILAIAIGQVDAAKKKGTVLSLEPAKGYFHQVHTKQLGLNCNNCHSAENSDLLFLRKDDAVPVGMPGQVNRSICLGCHRAPSRPAWYGLSR
jgi:hypothetical protein